MNIKGKELAEQIEYLQKNKLLNTIAEMIKLEKELGIRVSNDGKYLVIKEKIKEK